MKIIALAAAAAAAISFVATPVWAQGNDGSARMREQLRKGDRVTLRLDDAGVIKGRIESIGPEGLVVRADGREERVPFAAVVEARRKRLSFIMGTVIGAGAGAGLGIPVYSLVESEGGSGAGAIGGMMLMGAGIGAAIDALVNFEHAVYRRGRAARLSIEPAVADRHRRTPSLKSGFSDLLE